MSDKLKLEWADKRREPVEPSVSSGRRGRPLSEILERVEARNPALAARSGLSSAAMRAGAMVREMRKSQGLSQSDLAGKIGVSQERISEIERGVGPQGPTFELLERVAKACGKRIAMVPAEETLPVLLAEAAPAGLPAEDLDGIAEATR